jgi:hypothetical protein
MTSNKSKPVCAKPDLVPVKQLMFEPEKNNEALVPCKSCGRNFYPHRLLIHEKSCKGIEQVKPKTAKVSKLK